MSNVNENVKIDVSKISQEDLHVALELLNKKRVHDARVKSGEIKSQKWSDKSAEAKKKHIEYNKKRTARINLLAKLAIEKGLDKEVK